MIPILFKFEFNSPGAQAFLYLVALGLVAYIALSGWRGAQGPLNPKTKEFDPPDAQQRWQRAGMFGAGALVLAYVGLHYALPPTVPFFNGKGEGIPIHTYGVLLASGFILAATLLGHLALQEWRGEEGLRKRDQLMDMTFWILVGGIVGSRVLFIIVNWKDYVQDTLSGTLSKVFDLGGGLVFYGGLIGASIAALAFARKHDINFAQLADLCLPTVSLGQCLGRLGCFSAGCCWGDVARPDMKFGVHFPGAMAKNLFGQIGGAPSLAFQSQQTDPRWVVEETGKLFHNAVPNAVQMSTWVNEHGHTLPVHPTQLYESAGQFCLMILFLFLRRYRRFHGQIAGMWLMSYAVLRSTVELFRGDLERGTLHGLVNQVPAEAWYNISTSQFISLCMFTGGAVILYRGAQKVMAASTGALATA